MYQLLKGIAFCHAHRVLHRVSYLIGPTQLHFSFFVVGFKAPKSINQQGEYYRKTYWDKYIAYHVFTLFLFANYRKVNWSWVISVLQEHTVFLFEAIRMKLLLYGTVHPMCWWVHVNTPPQLIYGLLDVFSQVKKKEIPNTNVQETDLLLFRNGFG